ncbi:MAG: aminomethyltransferase beta-barrel domain-containing protein, partial [Betaproteobacteria bacterium]
QYLVLYDGDVCLGGGVIEASDAPDEREPAPAQALGSAH